jgi:hypothetical protein
MTQHPTSEHLRVAMKALEDGRDHAREMLNQQEALFRLLSEAEDALKAFEAEAMKG